MPQINHYEVEVVVRFKVDGPLSHHEAVRAAEARVSKSLKGEGPAYSDPVSAAHIVSVTAEDTTIRPLVAGGGHR